MRQCIANKYHHGMISLADPQMSAGMLVCRVYMTQGLYHMQVTNAHDQKESLTTWQYCYRCNV